MVRVPCKDQIFGQLISSGGFTDLKPQWSFRKQTLAFQIHFWMLDEKL